MGMSAYVRRLRERIRHEYLLMPSVAAIVRDGEGRILLVQSVEGHWQLPGGAVDPDEHPQEALRRECLEEANAVVRPTRLLAAVGGPGHRYTYENGDEVGFVVSVYEVELLGGHLRSDHDETQAVGWYAEEDLEQLELSPVTRATLAELLDPARFFPAGG
jgi:8-oxo-dGTP pyrophosphatase MutT (NUDIX family)